MIYPRFLDVEASSLNVNSYPIEIAWSDALGNIECHLINPLCIGAWVDWDYNAQNLHGISRETCIEHGVSPKELCELMSRSITPGEQIFADGGGFDEYWVDELFSAGSELGYAQFQVIHSDTVTAELLTRFEPDNAKRLNLFESLKLKARKRVDGRHRAAVDVQYLIELYKLCHDISR